MIDESPVTEANPLSPRVGIAQLSLQLRRTLHDAAAAEAAAALEPEVAVAQLRAKLAPRLAERRQALDDDLRREEAQARAAIAEALTDADRIVAAAEERAATARAALAATAAPADEIEATPGLPPPALAPEPAFAPEPVRADTVVAAVDAAPPAASPYDGIDDLDDRDDLGTDEPEAVEVLADDPTEAPPAAGLTLPATIGDPWAEGGRAVHVVIDADAFAKAFAAALGPVLDALHQPPTTAMVPQTYVPQPYLPVGYAPVTPAPERTQSFWSHAWHPDVLLSGLAMVIVVIVLIAWTG